MFPQSQRTTSGFGSSLCTSFIYELCPLVWP